MTDSLIAEIDEKIREHEETVRRYRYSTPELAVARAELSWMKQLILEDRERIIKELEAHKFLTEYYDGDGIEHSGVVIPLDRVVKIIKGESTQ